MAVKFTEEQLNTFNKSLLIRFLVDQQEQNEKLTNELHDLNEKLQLIMEHLVLSNKKRFGTSSEKVDIENQICFFEKDGDIVFFNESEAVFDFGSMNQKNSKLSQQRRKKFRQKGRRYFSSSCKCHQPLHVRRRTDCRVR